MLFNLCFITINYSVLGGKKNLTLILCRKDNKSSLTVLGKLSLNHLSMINNTDTSCLRGCDAI